MEANIKTTNKILSLIKSRLRLIILVVIVGLLVSGALLIAFDSEIRSGLFFVINPQAFREAALTRYTDSTGQEIYLLGTVHGAHWTTKDYSALHLQAVLENLQPDLLLVESRPEEIARDNLGDGPFEMLFTNLIAKSKGITVQGMDWWVMSATHEINNDEREDRMFQNIITSLPGHHTVLILTGFSHVEGFQQRFLASRYHQVAIQLAEKQALFDTIAYPILIFPSGMTYYVQKRIETDQQTVDGLTDDFWKDRLASSIISGKVFLTKIAAIGEQKP